MQPPIDPMRLPINFIALSPVDNSIYIVNENKEWEVYVKYTPVYSQVTDTIYECANSHAHLSRDHTVPELIFDEMTENPSPIKRIITKRPRGRPRNPEKPNKRKSRPPTKYNIFIANYLKENPHASMQEAGNAWTTSKNKENQKYKNM